MKLSLVGQIPLHSTKVGMNMRFFNTAGPVNCKDHYCLPPLERFNLEDILMLIGQRKYFILHAPRQVGKTTFLLALRDYLNKEGEYKCLYINVEPAQAAREKVKAAILTILSHLALEAKSSLQDAFPSSIYRDVVQEDGSYGALFTVLSLWAEASNKPIVLLIDEIDSLVGDTLVSVLRQLRSGYTKRPESFPQSIILCGVRDVRDYRLHVGNKAMVAGGSAFNIKAKSLRMGDFNHEETLRVYNQHTKETGQAFTAEALSEMWELTQGQPWLVNALGYETCFEMKKGRDREKPITVDMVLEAKENLILRRETHLDQLIHKLSEPRIKRVIEPILAGDTDPENIPNDDITYAYDLGLIKTEGQLKIANPIYQEVIPRELTYSTQLTISQEPAWYIEQGRLNMDKLLSAFQQFFREHSESWVERFDYKEAGPQLLLQAFLQRIINSGGRIEREYGLGKKRTDLLILWPYQQAESPTHIIVTKTSEVWATKQIQKVVVELKLLRKSLESTLVEGLQQTWEYMDKCASEEGHLIIFDRSKKVWEEKIFKREEVYYDQKIVVWGM